MQHIAYSENNSLVDCTKKLCQNCPQIVWYFGRDISADFFCNQLQKLKSFQTFLHICKSIMVCKRIGHLCVVQQKIACLGRWLRTSDPNVTSDHDVHFHEKSIITCVLLLSFGGSISKQRNGRKLQTAHQSLR